MANLVRQETQRVNRELEQLRTRSSQSTADLRADIEKIRVFSSEEISRISLSIEDAKQLISESSSTAMSEDSVRRVVKEVLSKDKKK